MVRRLFFNAICLAILTVAWLAKTNQTIEAAWCCAGDLDCHQVSDHDYSCLYPTGSDYEDCWPGNNWGSCYNSEHRHCVGLNESCAAEDDCCHGPCNGQGVCNDNGNGNWCGEEWDFCWDSADCCYGLGCNYDYECVTQY